jgi:hypothetical protein
MNKEKFRSNLITLCMIATIMPGGFILLIIILSHKGIMKYKNFKRK